MIAILASLGNHNNDNHKVGSTQNNGNKQKDVHTN